MTTHDETNAGRYYINVQIRGNFYWLHINQSILSFSPLAIDAGSFGKDQANNLAAIVKHFHKGSECVFVPCDSQVFLTAAMRQTLNIR